MRRDRRRALVSLAFAGVGGSAAAGLLSGCALTLAAASSDPTEETTMEASANTLPVTLGAEARRSAHTAALEIRVRARNESAAPLDLLLWNTPFETVVSADLFEIVREGDDEPLAYRGRLVKRALPPPDEAIVTLSPGERLERILDLSRYYPLDRPGRYTVSLKPRPVPLAVDGRELVELRAADTRPLVVERF